MKYTVTKENPSAETASRLLSLGMMGIPAAQAILSARFSKWFFSNKREAVKFAKQVNGVLA
jgi:hypothetical protein